MIAHPTTTVNDVNPMVPTTMGALLAEEWTIDPQSILPSFFEMMMIAEARRSGHEALKSGFSFVESKLDEFVNNDDSPVAGAASNSDLSPTTTENDNNNTDENQTSPRRSRWFEFKKKAARILLYKILKPWNPEIRCLIIYLVQRGSLLSSDAAASETIYGGKRVKLETRATGASLGYSEKRRLTPMSRKDGIRLAFLLSFSTYFEERVDGYFQSPTSSVDDSDTIVSSSSSSSSSSPSRIQKLKKMIKFLHPFMHISIQGVHLVEQWRFLLGRSVFFDPYSKFLNLVVRRVTEQDQIQDEKNNSSKKKQQNKLLESTLDTSKAILNNALFKKTVVGVLTTALAIGWMARVRKIRQRLRRQVLPNQQQQQQQQQSENNDFIPPPPAPLAAKNPDLLSLPATVCPLCRQTRINPTATTAGYVFCLLCITSHVRENPKCPITGRDCPESALVRLYEPNTG
ncbi:unnamed protein product [Cylindrotheca closterium]|uniref:Peroxin-12 n=1 Tax=Cylindrotheca closterium TaxID=2856 RepID=A0AAD2G023_9STRA|nr:unnamed protein product [Cylindrotheca closterium]